MIKVFLCVQCLWNHMFAFATNTSIISEAKGLVDFYFATNGDFWIDNSGWEFVHSLDISNITMAQLCNNHPFGIYCYCPGGFDCHGDEYQLTLLKFASNNLSGTLPESMFSTIPYLTEIEITNNPLLHGTIPSTICGFGELNVHGAATKLDLSNNSLYGTLPKCFLYSNGMVLLGTLSVAYNKLNGTIYSEPNTNQGCGLGAGGCDIFLNNNQFTGEIPLCVLNSCCVVDLSNNQFNGSLPSWQGTPDVDLSNNQLYGTIPLEIFNLSQMCFEVLNGINVRLSNNNLYGTVPWTLFKMLNTFCHEYAMEYTGVELDLSSNALTHIETLNNVYNVTNNNKGTNINVTNNCQANVALLFHNNKLQNNNIGILLNNILTLLNVKELTLHGNDALSGNINQWVVNTSSLQYLTLHNNDIYGSFRSDGTLTYNMNYFTLYNNRISCSVSNSFMKISNNTEYNGQSLILLGNLMTIENGIDNIDFFKNSPFRGASNLYLNGYDSIMDDMYLGTTLVCLILLFCLKLVHLVCVDRFKFKYSHCNSAMIIGFMFDIFSHYIFVLILIILSILYYFFSNYYECGRTVSHFAITYFMNNNGEYNLLLQTFVIVLATSLSCFVLFSLIKLANSDNSKFRFESIQTLTMIENDNDDECKLKEYKSNCKSNCSNCRGGISANCSNIIWAFALLSAYMVGAIIDVCYILIQSLPQKNVEMFGSNVSVFSSHVYYLLDYSLAFILTIINIYIVPKLVDSLWRVMGMCTCRNQNNHIATTNLFKRHFQIRTCLSWFLRSLITIVIPLISSIIFLNNCGNYWTTFWKPCTNTINERMFNIHFSNVTISTADSICYVNNNIISDASSVNQCLRSFFDHWLPIITLKLILFILNPFILYWFKEWNVKHNCCKCICCCKSHKHDHESKTSSNLNKKHSKSIDWEYAAIATKMEVAMIFMLISPYIIVLISLGLYSNYVVYSWITQSTRWKIVYLGIKRDSAYNMVGITDYQFSINDFPTYIVFMSLIVGQCLFVGFFWVLFDCQVMYAFVVLHVLLDCVCGMCIFCQCSLLTNIWSLKQ